MIFFKARRVKKAGADILRQAKHLRNMCEDILGDAELSKLSELESELRLALKGDNLDSIEAISINLRNAVVKSAPTSSHVILRENLEVFVVAIIIAMAVRTYFLQPFKIPTGSMQETLCGIKVDPVIPVGGMIDSIPAPKIIDKLPLKFVKWLATGDWYTEVRAERSGELVDLRRIARSGVSAPVISVGGKTQKVPRNARLFRPDGYVSKGTLLWAGSVTAGDHVFVDKVSWNFRRPKRGEIMVFNTDDIPIQLPSEPPLPRGTHYIKRMVGLPEETISIDPPNLLINGQPVVDCKPIQKISQGIGYRYTYPDRSRPPPPLAPRLFDGPDVSLDLGKGEYFALGDNTISSKDGRYWGAVPEKNLVGPAVIVYWPFSKKRWGWAH